ncbi:MAG: TRAP-type transport system periplasmic protein [Acetobacteraceae bacterium]|jgi:tripartite ATP-independent transporter DctP family solute receptor|nr:transporter substrate-binding protein [Rhodopila sp.]MEA2769485.1 TRAP-type transport system periplasmic protein [Acetobacteraceae bacterium]
MPKIGRRAFAATAATAPVVFSIRPSRAQTAEFVFKFGNNVPETYPLNVRATQAADRIRSATNGRFDLRIFPAGQLGTDTDMLSQVRSGAIEFYTASGLVLSTLVPLTAINALGFAFRDYSQVWPAMDGKLGDTIRAKIETAGLHPIEKIFDIGFREVSSSTHPITDPESFKGFKVRIPPSQLGVSMFRALGASPATLNFAEAYTALQTHVVDGQENPLSIIDTAKFFEVQKYVSMTNHMWDGYWLLCNGRAWKSLPDDVRAVVSRELNRAAEEDRMDIAALDASLKARLESKGMVFNTPDPEPFRSILKRDGFYEQWRKTFGNEAWDVVESYVGRLA